MPDTIRRMTGTMLITFVSLLLLPALPAGAEYQVDGDVVADSETGLMWMQSDAGEEKNWQEALAYCQKLNLHGYTDWRLPDLNELESLVDYTRFDPAIDPVFSCRSKEYWSSSPNADDFGRASCVHFDDGIAPYYYYKSDTYYVRCVRGGP